MSFQLGGRPQHLKPLEAARELRESATAMVASVQMVLDKAPKSKPASAAKEPEAQEPSRTKASKPPEAPKAKAADATT